MSCSTYDCAQDLHCYSRIVRGGPKFNDGACKACGSETIDWERIRIRNQDDVRFTFDCLKKEWIRHHFWHEPFDEVALRKARKKGKIAVLVQAGASVRKRVAAAQPFRDGMQTPFSGDVVWYGQHATAACCRKCIEHWHGIPKGRELSEDEIAYLTQLVVLYLEERLVDLPDTPELLPQRKRRKRQKNA